LEESFGVRKLQLVDVLDDDDDTNAQDTKVDERPEPLQILESHFQKDEEVNDRLEHHKQ
jgi:hypothetical protein